MTQIQIDFSEVQDFQALPEGNYPVTIDHVEMKQGDAAPYLNFDTIVSDGEYAGRHLFTNLSLSEKSLWRLKSVLANLHVLEDQMVFEVDEESNYVLTPEFAGLPAIAVVSTELYKGKLQNRIDDLVSADEAPVSMPAKVAVPAPKAALKPTMPAAGATPPAKTPVSFPAKKPSLRLK